MQIPINTSGPAEHDHDPSVEDEQVIYAPFEDDIEEIDPQFEHDSHLDHREDAEGRSEEDGAEAAADIVDVDVDPDLVVDSDLSDSAGSDMVPKEELDALQQRYDRLLADWENYRRRSSDELEKAKIASNRNMIEALIPTIDNFALAIDHAKASDTAGIDGMMKGFEAIYSSLLSQLAREGMEVISPQVGDPFDMMEHQAVERREDSEFDRDSVAAVIQSGYKFKDYVLRPAMVAVSV